MQKRPEALARYYVTSYWRGGGVNKQVENNRFPSPPPPPPFPVCTDIMKRLIANYIGYIVFQSGTEMKWLCVHLSWEKVSLFYNIGG